MTTSLISTFLTYRNLTTDLSKSLAHVATERQVKTEADYYQQNIGKVKSVDDFMKNPRLYNYAMKAFGLEDFSYAKAYIRKALVSDVSDADSFVRKLVDPRFLTLAKAFNFSTDGSVKTSTIAAQDTNDENDTIGLYSQYRVAKGTTAAADAAYYQSHIGSVHSVDDLLANSRLTDYALEAYGIDASIASTASIRQVLTSDLSDPSSYANQMTRPAYRSLAAAFSFATDGSTVGGGPAQTDTQITNTVYASYDSSGAGNSPAAAAFKTDYFQDNIGSVATVDDLLNNSKLYNYALTAFGLTPGLESKATIKAVLTSDLSDPASFANQQSNAAYRDLAAAFNFAADGTTTSAPSSDQLAKTTDGYLAKYDDASVASEGTATEYYKSILGKISLVDDLLKDARLYGYVMTAFGFDTSVESQSKIRLVLTSDLSNPASYANTTRDARYKTLAAAFNFGTDGKAQTLSAAQSSDSMLSTAQLYDINVDDVTVENATTKAENTYYSDTMAKIKTADDLVKDKRLVTYLLKAYDLSDQNISNATLRKAIASDPLDPKSFINEKGNEQLRALTVALNFDADGNISQVAKSQPQTRTNLIATADLYIRQTLEEDEGDSNEGVRLALYFQRKAPNITSPYSILADKALLQVVQTALSLPAAVSAADIDVQANIITKKLDLTDLQDPKKLEKFLARFSALYDLANSDSSSGSLVTQLFG